MNRDRPVLPYATPRPRRLTLWNDPRRSGTFILLVLACWVLGMFLLFLAFVREN